MYLRFFYLLLVVFVVLTLPACASNKIYIDADEVSGVGAVVEFPTGKIIPIEIKTVLSPTTLKLTNGEVVSYIGVYVPDISSIAKDAKRLNEDFVSSNEIRFEFDKRQRDSKRRLLAYVFTSDGRMINEELLTQGLAQVLIDPENSKYKQRLVAAEQEARDSMRGIWSGEL